VVIGTGDLGGARVTVELPVVATASAGRRLKATL